MAEVEAKLREKGLDPESTTIDDLHPQELSPEGTGLSLMSGFELDIWVPFGRLAATLQKVPAERGKFA